jgi:hypothetical protein
VNVDGDKDHIKPVRGRDFYVDGPLWVVIPRAAFSICSSVVLILVLFWLSFGELGTFAYVFAGSLGVFQILLVFGLRNAKDVMPPIPLPTDLPARDAKSGSRDD